MTESGKKTKFSPYGETHSERFYTLGEEVISWRYGLLRFIRSTEKGFNFLIVDKNRVLFKRAFYDRRWSHKEIPDTQQKFRVLMPAWAIRLGI